MTEAPTFSELDQQFRKDQAPLLDCLRESIEATLRAEQAKRRGPANDN